MATGKMGGRGIIKKIKTAVLSDHNSYVKTSNFYIQTDVFEAKSVMPIPRQKLNFERPSIMVFADDAPQYNWSHPCRYLLYDAETGEQYDEVKALFPPYSAEKEMPKTYQVFHESVVFKPERYFPIEIYPLPYFRWFGNRYAILFSGMSNNRHTNDLEFAYRMLTKVYGFSPANITVLNYDGTLNYSGGPQPATSWPGNNTAYQMPVHGAGTKQKLLDAIDALKSKLKPNDLLFIHTNNHGGHTGVESDLCCYPSYASLGVKEFTDKLAELPVYRCLMVMMEQCHSGGFNNAVISKSTASNTSIASACREDSNSIGGAHFDPFARDWIAAMMGKDPYGNPLVYNPDTGGNGRVSAKEAFDYANAIHDPYDTPVFSYKNGGRSCWLGRLFFWFPHLDLILIEKIIKKRWPEPDPVEMTKFFERIDKDYLALEEKTEASMNALRKEYEVQLERLLK